METNSTIYHMLSKGQQKLKCIIPKNNDECLSWYLNKLEMCIAHISTEQSNSNRFEYLKIIYIEILLYSVPMIT